MAHSKEDIRYGTAQAKLSEDDALRVAYKSGTPLEGGKIADSEPVDLLANAHNIQKAKHDQAESAKASATSTDEKKNDQPSS